MYKIVVVENGERVVYEGADRREAEHIFINGFQFHFAEEYYLECSNEEARHEILLMTHRVIESIYMKVISSLGYDVLGKWEVSSYFKGEIPNTIDEVGIKLNRIMPKVAGNRVFKGGEKPKT